MTGTPGATGSYTYDAGGDPTKVVDPTNGTPTTQTFNAAGEVTKATPHVTTGTAATFTYDSIGARTSEKMPSWAGGSITYGYAQTGQLSGVTMRSSPSSASTAYAYSGSGLRMGATETIGSTHESQKFTWDTQTGTPELLADGTHYFIYGPTGQVIEQENETATLKNPLYLVHNALGSTVASISSTHVVSTATYNAYGAVVGHSGPNTTPIGFAGAYTDPVSGLLYLVNRYYDPTTGEFLSVDPDVSTTHEPYEYADDDPMNNTDPSGDSWSTTFWTIENAPVPKCRTNCPAVFSTEEVGFSDDTYTKLSVNGGDPLSVYIVDAQVFPDTTFWVCAEPMNDCQMSTLVYGEGMRVDFGSQDAIPTSGGSGTGAWVGQGYDIKIEAEVDPIPSFLGGSEDVPDPLYAIAVGSYNGLPNASLDSYSPPGSSGCATGIWT